MKLFLYKILTILPVAILVAGLPLEKGSCECAIKGEVCGDPPTWNSCCEAEKYECKKIDEADYGECVEKEEEEQE